MFSPVYRGLFNKKSRDLPISLKLKAKIFEKFAPVVDALDGCELLDDGIRVTSDHALQYLTGGWLEAMIFEAVSNAFEGRNDVEIASNVVVGNAHKAKMGTTDLPAETDLDLAVLGDDRLHIVQAKANMDPKGFHDAITKLAQYRNHLSGLSWALLQ